MSRHCQRAEHRLGRFAFGVGVVGVGVLPVGAPALASTEPVPPSTTDATVATTPCATTAKACVSISKKKAWLTDGEGEIVRGPVPVSTGATGSETPEGTFHVMWKDRDHVSSEPGHVEMPWSVFFAPGDAFHGGSLRHQSAGCVHLDSEDAEDFFDYLQVNDEVQIVP